jgi:hypothetical protein
MLVQFHVRTSSAALWTSSSDSLGCSLGFLPELVNVHRSRSQTALPGVSWSLSSSIPLICTSVTLFRSRGKLSVCSLAKKDYMHDVCNCKCQPKCRMLASLYNAQDICNIHTHVTLTCMRKWVERTLDKTYMLCLQMQESMHWRIECGVSRVCRYLREKRMLKKTYILCLQIQESMHWRIECDVSRVCTWDTFFCHDTCSLTNIHITWDTLFCHDTYWLMHMLDLLHPHPGLSVVVWRRAKVCTSCKYVCTGFCVTTSCFTRVCM